MAGSGVRPGARLRSSYVDGTIQEDGNAEANIYGASDNGISVGVYFFSQATTVDEAIEEAKYVLSVIRHKDITMPVAFDMEPVTEDDRIGIHAEHGNIGHADEETE